MKYLSLILCICFSLMMPCAVYASGATIYTEASSDAVYGGQEFNVSVYISGTYDGYCFNIPEYEKFDIVKVSPVSGSINADKIGNSWMISVIGGLSKTDAGKEKIADITLKAKDGVMGKETLSLEGVFITTNTGDLASISENYAEIRIAAISFKNEGGILTASSEEVGIGDKFIMVIYDTNGIIRNVKFIIVSAENKTVSGKINEGERAEVFLWNQNMSPKTKKGICNN